MAVGPRRVVSADYTRLRHVKTLGVRGFLRGGEGEIRTLGTLRYFGFQDRCTKPLCDLSLELLAPLRSSSFVRDTPNGVPPLAERSGVAEREGFEPSRRVIPGLQV